MTIQKPSVQYVEKAKLLSREDAERILSRLRGKLSRRVDDKKIFPLEAVAIQLELEDKQLKEWRQRMMELSAKHKK